MRESVWGWQMMASSCLGLVVGEQEKGPDAVSHSAIGQGDLTADVREHWVQRLH